MQILPLSRDETTLYKGVGILLIVLHNYLHNIPPMIGENEFWFSQPIAARFANTMASSPTEWVRAAFTYLGHYGVQLFVFLSAYGLVRRHRARSLPYWRFLTGRFDKVYLPFVAVAVVYTVLWPLKGWLLGDAEPFAWRSLLLKFALISNFVPGEALRPVGPWWFLPFIFQFYLVFPVLLSALERFGPRALFYIGLASLVIEWAINPAAMSIGLNVNHMVFGHLPLLCLGMYAATLQNLRVTWASVAVVGLVFVAGNVSRTAWLLADVAAGLLLLLVPYGLLHRLSAKEGHAYRTLRFFGTVSMPLFLVNGFLRTPFTQPAVALNRWWFTLLCAAASLAFSTLIAFLLHWSETRIRSILRQRGAVPLPERSPTAVP